MSAVWGGTQGPMRAALSQLSPVPVSAWIFLNLRKSQQPSVCPGLVCGDPVSGSAITSHSNLGTGTVHIYIGQLKTLRPKEQWLFHTSNPGREALEPEALCSALCSFQGVCVTLPQSVTLPQCVTLPQYEHRPQKDHDTV